MSEIENEVVDLYKEHSQHTAPYWKLKSKCSECFKKHNEIMERSRDNGFALYSGDWREQRSHDNAVLSSLYSRDYE